MSFDVYCSSQLEKNCDLCRLFKNLKERIKLHNSGKGAKFTRGRKWKLIYKEKCKTKNQAILREYYIKKNRKLRNLIKNR